MFIVLLVCNFNFCNVFVSYYYQSYAGLRISWEMLCSSFDIVKVFSSVEWMSQVRFKQALFSCIHVILCIFTKFSKTSQPNSQEAQLTQYSWVYKMLFKNLDRGRCHKKVNITHNRENQTPSKIVYSQLYFLLNSWEGVFLVFPSHSIYSFSFALLTYIFLF